MNNDGLSQSEKVNLLFKNYMNFTTTADSKAFFEETELPNNDNIFSNNILTKSPPTDPSYTHVNSVSDLRNYLIYSGFTDVSINDNWWTNKLDASGATFEVDSTSDSDRTVLRLTKIKLDYLKPGTAAFVCKDNNGINILQNLIPSNYASTGYGLSLHYNKSGELKEVGWLATIPEVSGKGYVDLSVNFGGALFDSKNGVVTFYDVSGASSSVFGEISGNFYLTATKYIGPKGVAAGSGEAGREITITGDDHITMTTDSDVVVHTGLAQMTFDTDDSVVSLTSGTLSLANIDCNTMNISEDLTLGTGKNLKLGGDVTRDSTSGIYWHTGEDYSIARTSGWTYTPPTSAYTNNGEHDHSGDGDFNSNGWFPKSGYILIDDTMSNVGSAHYLQIDLGIVRPTVKGFHSMGREDNPTNSGVYGQYVTSFMLTYSLNGTEWTADNNNVYNINEYNTGTTPNVVEEETLFVQSLRCRYIRVYPKTAPSYPAIRVSKFIIGDWGNPYAQLQLKWPTGIILSTNPSINHDKGFIDCRGLLGVNVTSKPTTQFEVNGDSKFSGNVNLALGKRIYLGGDVGNTLSHTAGVYWHTAEDYAITRTAGAWSGDFQQLLIRWGTGIILDINNADYGKSFVDVKGKLGVNVSSKPSTQFEVDGDSKLSGNVDIADNLEVAGDVIAGGSITSSDNRVKHNEEDISGCLQTISKLKPQKYLKTKSLHDGSNNYYGTDHHFDLSNVPDDANWESGFIAQEVRVIPELSHLVMGEESVVDVSGNEIPTSLALNYNSLHAYEVGAIKELLERVKYLEQEIQILKNNQ